MERNLISRSDTYRFRNLGNKVATYRQCANIPAQILASRVHITERELEAIESGANKNLGTALTLRLATELGVTYADLFESDNDTYYTNIHDDEVMKYIIGKCKSYRFKTIADKLDIQRSNFTNWKTRNYIPSPFVLGNIMTFLKITPVELEGLTPTIKPVIENEPEVTQKVEEEKNIDMMSQVIEACNMYKNIETMRAELDEIIAKAQELRKMLGGE